MHSGPWTHHAGWWHTLSARWTHARAARWPSRKGHGARAAGAWWWAAHAAGRWHHAGTHRAGRWHHTRRAARAAHHAGWRHTRTAHHHARRWTARSAWAHHARTRRTAAWRHPTHAGWRTTLWRHHPAHHARRRTTHRSFTGKRHGRWRAAHRSVAAAWWSAARRLSITTTHCRCTSCDGSLQSSVFIEGWCGSLCGLFAAKRGRPLDGTKHCDRRARLERVRAEAAVSNIFRQEACAGWIKMLPACGTRFFRDKNLGVPAPPELTEVARARGREAAAGLLAALAGALGASAPPQCPRRHRPDRCSSCTEAAARPPNSRGASEHRSRRRGILRLSMRPRARASGGRTQQASGRSPQLPMTVRRSQLRRLSRSSRAGTTLASSASRRAPCLRP